MRSEVRVVYRSGNTECRLGFNVSLKDFGKRDIGMHNHADSVSTLLQKAKSTL